MYDITRQETYHNIRKWLRYVDEVSVSNDRPDCTYHTCKGLLNIVFSKIKINGQATTLISLRARIR